MSRIVVNAKVDSDLDWSREKEQAKAAESIVWELDLGLFSELKQPLSNEAQFRSLALSLQHFCETLLEEFQEKTEAISLFRGSADLSDEEAEYLELLRCSLPEDAVCLLEFDWIEDPLRRAELTMCDCYRDYHVKGDFSDEQAAIGLCLPEKESEALRPIMQKLLQQKISFRVIPESQLTMQWHGLDDLIYVPAGTSQQGMRKLQGFAAAGGTLISTEEPIENILLNSRP